MFKIIFYLFILCLSVFGQEECISCHNIEAFDTTNHNFTCKQCHLLPNKQENYEHKTDIIAHPDSLKYAPIFCAKCHEKDIDAVQHSLHVSLKNEINKTRKTWGIKDSNVTLQTLPKAHENIAKPQDLADDFLRRKCLKCHIGNQGSGESGMYRGKGCMSCHMSYAKDGKYKGSDLTQIGKKPRAKVHKLSKKPPMSACLSCHNKTFVGSDYLGLFPKDFDEAYKAPITKSGKYPPTLYGTSYHHLQADVHLKAGLTCVSCHKKGKEKHFTTLTCKECHTKISNNEAHASYHEKLDCSACHASWQMSNYELSVFRDDMADYVKWKNLTNQEDAYLQSFLQKAFKAKIAPKPYMPDWVDEKMKEGIWYSGWRFRRWENLLLGNDANGSIKILRPIYQYRISYRDKNGTMILDDVSEVEGKKFEAFSPYVPHTTAKVAKSCESCHENPLLLSPVKSSGTVLDLLHGNVSDGSALSKEQLEKLQSQKYKKIRAKMLF
jgi:hypothetical protein